MKIKKYLSIIALGALAFTACTKDYYNDQFEGLEEMQQITDVRTLEYTLTDEDYALMASSASKISSDNSAAFAAVGAAKSFTDIKQAQSLIPYYLAYTGGQFFTLSNNSSIKVTYNVTSEADPYIAEVTSNLKSYTVSTNDYKAAWGSEEDYVEMFTPTTVNKLASSLPKEGYEAGDYVAVTYKYAESEPLFSQVGGEEPEEPATGYTNVLGSAALNDAVEVKGYISALSSQGPILTDNGGSLLLYKGSDLAIGDEVTVSGTIAAYNKGFQIAAGSSTVTKTGTTTVAYPTAVELTGAAMDEAVKRTDNAYAQFVKVVGKVSISGTYYNFTVDGAETAQGSFYGLQEPLLSKIEDGKTVTIYGYFCNISSSRYVNIVATHIDEEPAIANSYTSVLGSAALNDAVEVKGYISALSSQGPILTDNGGSLLLYKGSDLAIGDEVTVSGTIAAYNKGFQIAAGSSTVTKTGTTTVAYPTAVELTGAAMDEAVKRTDNAYAQFVKVVGKVSISGTYYNFTVDGAETAQGSFYGLQEPLLSKIEDGKTVTIYGYFCNISSSRYVNIVATAIEDAAGTRAAVSTPASVNKYAFFQFDGSKFNAVDLAIIQPSDFTAMGNTYGSITDGTQAQYLPKFLAVTYPYAKEDDTKYVAYRKYANSTTVWALDKYLFDGNEWNTEAGYEATTDQFVRQNGKWTWNPSVVITLPVGRNQPLSTQYFQAVTDWVYENIDVPLGSSGKTSGDYFVTSYGNNEYYTGASAYQGNVDVRPSAAKGQYSGNSYQSPELVAAGVAFDNDGYANMSDAEIQNLLIKRFQYVFGKVLGVLHPDAVPVEGMTVTYTINTGFYNGSSTPAVTLVYNVVGPGEFEFAEMTGWE